MPLRSKRSGLALQVLQNAHKDLEGKLSGLHLQEFRQTSLEDARKAVLDTEARMASRGCLRNTRRLMPLFEGLQHYSRVIEVLCNGVPFMPLVWAPIRFIINVTCENVKAFDKIIVQYSRIGEALMRFKTLQATFAEYPEFQQIVAVFYSDILEFNGEAYKFVTRSAWELFFLTSWGRFERRFESIMQNLEAHAKLLDDTANALDIAEARRSRELLQQERVENLAKVVEAEKARHASLYQEISAWLKVDDTEQALVFDSITQEVAKYPGTCDWVIQHDRLRTWLRDGSGSGFLWLQGSPGSGKTSLANRLVAFLQTRPDSIVVRHFCNALTPVSMNYDSILRSLLFQLVRTNEDLVAYIHSLKTTEFLEKTVTPKALEDIIKNVFGAVCSNLAKSYTIHIVVDGLDVCDEEKQKRLIWLLERLVTPAISSTCSYKVLLVSRRTELLRKRMRNMSKISLNDEAKHVTSSIESYARQRFGSMRSRLHELGIGDLQVRTLSEQLAAKADGMFLWARLVLDYVSRNVFHHGHEIENAISVLPRELGEFYEKILRQTLSNFDKQSVQRLTSMFGWIAYAKRPMKRVELQSAITFASGNPQEEEVVPSYVLGLCSQLVEERPDSTLALIHSSVKEYLQSPEALLKLSDQAALVEHATASITCLLSATRCFTSQEVNQKKQQQLVLRGLHAFQLYAQEHWIDYILALGSSDGPVQFHDALHDLMHRLSSTLDEMHQHDAPKPPADSPLDPRLSCIDHLPGLHGAGAAILKARLLGLRATNEEILAVGPSTALGQVLCRYQAIIRDILSRQNVAGISLDKLANFQETHRVFAFTCRLGGCRRLAAGFETEKLRDQHEESHRSFLRCEAVGCHYPPFVSARGLQRHVREVHADRRPRRPIRRISTGATLVNSRKSQTQTPTPASSAVVFGGIPAPAPTTEGLRPPSPPAPEWAIQSLQLLQERYPHDQLDVMMRYVCVNPETNALSKVAPGQDTPPGHKWMWLPRIKCHDCPGKVYPFGPETTTGNFEQHLVMRMHRRAVNFRVGATLVGSRESSESPVDPDLRAGVQDSRWAQVGYQTPSRPEPVELEDTVEHYQTGLKPSATQVMPQEKRKAEYAALNAYFDPNRLAESASASSQPRYPRRSDEEIRLLSGLGVDIGKPNPLSRALSILAQTEDGRKRAEEAFGSGVWDVVPPGVLQHKVTQEEYLRLRANNPNVSGEDLLHAVTLQRHRKLNAHLQQLLQLREMQASIPPSDFKFDASVTAPTPQPAPGQPAEEMFGPGATSQLPSQPSENSTEGEAVPNGLNSGLSIDVKLAEAQPVSLNSGGQLPQAFQTPHTIPVFGSDNVLSKSPYVTIPEDFVAYLFNTQQQGDSSPMPGQVRSPMVSPPANGAYEPPEAPIKHYPTFRNTGRLEPDSDWQQLDRSGGGADQDALRQQWPRDWKGTKTHSPGPPSDAGRGTHIPPQHEDVSDSASHPRPPSATPLVDPATEKTPGDDHNLGPITNTIVDLEGRTWNQRGGATGLWYQGVAAPKQVYSGAMDPQPIPLSLDAQQETVSGAHSVDSAARQVYLGDRDPLPGQPLLSEAENKLLEQVFSEMANGESNDSITHGQNNQGADNLDEGVNIVLSKPGSQQWAELPVIEENHSYPGVAMNPLDFLAAYDDGSFSPAPVGPPDSPDSSEPHGIDRQDPPAQAFPAAPQQHEDTRIASWLQQPAGQGGRSTEPAYVAGSGLREHQRQLRDLEIQLYPMKGS